MSLVKFRVRVMEPFKDGNVLEGKQLMPEQVLVLDEQDFAKVVNSGGVLEVLEQLVPNPLKNLPSLVSDGPKEDPQAVDPEDVNDVVKEARDEGTGFGVESNPAAEPGIETVEDKKVKAKAKAHNAKVKAVKKNAK
ncbi:MAG TPA: hypothetical protein VIY48_20290 [Candidatus Paceibacterota bacterium]